MLFVQILTIVLGSALVASLVFAGLSRWAAARGRSTDAAMAALLVAHQLELYGRACAELVQADLTYVTSEGRHGAPAVSLPPFPDYAPETDWAALGVAVANEMLDFRAHILAARRSIAAWVDLDASEDACRECIRQSIDLGRKSYALAGSLRDGHDLPPVEATPGWDPEVLLASWKRELEPTVIAPLVEDVRLDAIKAALEEPIEDYGSRSPHPLFRN